MKFTVDRKVFAKAVNMVGLNGFQTISPLTLSADTDKGLTITSDFFPQHRQMVIPATVEAGGTMTGSAHLLSRRLPKTGAGEITVSGPANPETDSRITAAFGGVSIRFLFEMDSDAPCSVNGRSFDLIGTISAKTLLGLIGNVNYARCKDETKYNLCGIALRLKDGITHAAATDGHRLATSKAEGVRFERSIFLTSDLVDFLVKALPKDETPVEFHFYPSPIKEHTDGRLYKTSSDLLKVVCGSTVGIDSMEGEFPNIDKVIPAEGAPVQITMEPASLTEILKAIAALDTKRYRVGALFSIQNGSAAIIGRDNAFDAEITGSVPIAGTVSEPVKIVAAARYLLDALAKTGPAPLFEIKDELSPFKISSTVGGYENMAVVMPMRMP